VAALAVLCGNRFQKISGQTNRKCINGAASRARNGQDPRTICHEHPTTPRPPSCPRNSANAASCLRWCWRARSPNTAPSRNRGKNCAGKRAAAAQSNVGTCFHGLFAPLLSHSKTTGSRCGVLHDSRLVREKWCSSLSRRSRVNPSRPRFGATWHGFGSTASSASGASAALPVSSDGVANRSARNGLASPHTAAYLREPARSRS
jgi:hypothetical protein